MEKKVFIAIIVFLDIFIYAHGQTQLEEDEGLGQYDYLCISDSTWVHWSTDHATWGSAQVYVDVNGQGREFNSEWKHDWDGRKHLSTIEQLSPEYFPAGSYMPGYPIDLHLKLDGTTLNSYYDEMMLMNVVKRDTSGVIYNSSQQLVLQFYIDIGSVSGNRWLNTVHVKNLGTLEEGDGDKDIGYDQLKLYYETGTSFHFDGIEQSQNLWGDWGGDSKYNNEWKNDSLDIEIPAGERLYCYVVIEGFSPTLVMGRTAQFELVTDGLAFDNYGSMHKFKARVDARTNAFALPVMSLSYQAPCVVINSYYNAADPRDEWTELLVTQDNTDLRNFTLRDNNKDQSNWQEGITFNNIDLWNHLRAGTIIKLWHRDIDSQDPSPNPHPPDLSPADGYLEVHANDPYCFTGGNFGNYPNYGGPSLSIGGEGDIEQIRNAESEHVHALGHRGTAGVLFHSLPYPKLNHTESPISNTTLMVCPGGELYEYGVYEPQNGTIYTAKQSGEITPGLPNTCTSSSTANTLYWKTLREPLWNNPTGNGSYQNNNTQIQLNWNSCEDAYSEDSTTGYLILRSSTGSFTPPEDGFTYEVEDNIGTSKVVGIITSSTTTNFIDPIPAPCDGLMFYRIYAFRFSTDDLKGNNFHEARGRAYNQNSYTEIIVEGPPSPSTSNIWHY